jgi:acyl-CoA synthetase (AMP-forming)/AMP-acid ligase II
VIAWFAAARIGAFPELLPATYRAGELRRSLRLGDVALLIAPRTMLGKDYEPVLEHAIPGLVEHSGGDLLDPDVPYLRDVWVLPSSSRRWATPVDPMNAELSGSEVSDELLKSIEAEVSSADPLLTIYTSGSGADPKAIVHTHGASIRKVQGELGMCLPGSFPGRTFCAMPFFWVGGPQNLLGALHSGATVVTQERFEPGGALELLERERCTSIVGWASVYDAIASHPDHATRDLSALVFPAQQTMVSSRGHSRNLGMTETFGPHGNPEWFEYKVIDPSSGQILPNGDEGEFCVRGFGLMAGRYKQEREDVFDGDGWYHTGDLGYVEGGQIWFTGRLSEVIKTGGANVSPLEVEQLLESYPEVATSVVFGLADAGVGEVVAAAVVPRLDAEVDPEGLRLRLKDELSAYKVPKEWFVLAEDDIPRLASGKPDKRQLQERCRASRAVRPASARTNERLRVL